MNCQTDSVAANTREPKNHIKTPALLCLLALVAGLLTGCAHVQRYSIESWDGPLPLADIQRTQSDL
jgi:hypothetical protein